MQTDDPQRTDQRDHALGGSLVATYESGGRSLNLFGGRDAIGHMRPTEVDPVGLEPPQACLDGRDHGFATIAGDEDAGIGIGSEGELRRQHEVVAPSGHQIPQDLFGLTKLIAVGCVDEVTARVRVGVLCVVAPSR